MRSRWSHLVGNPARNRLSALRSLFQALKQERLVFRDPRGITPRAQSSPDTGPSDRLRGLIDRAGGPMAELVVALVAIHALETTPLRRTLLTDLDLGRRPARHPPQPRTPIVYLDELTLTQATDWLRERHRRWPATTNPHLLVTQQTALMSTHPPASRLVIHGIFQHLGVHASQLRQDRILDEAAATADPVHLMRAFGVSPETALHYVCIAHPERRSILPR